jgi:hypothetical protein
MDIQDLVGSSVGLGRDINEPDSPDHSFLCPWKVKADTLPVPGGLPGPGQEEVTQLQKSKVHVPAEKMFLEQKELRAEWR